MIVIACVRASVSMCVREFVAVRFCVCVNAFVCLLA